MEYDQDRQIHYIDLGDISENDILALLEMIKQDFAKKDKPKLELVVNRK